MNTDYSRFLGVDSPTNTSSQSAGGFGGWDDNPFANSNATFATPGSDAFAPLGGGGSFISDLLTDPPKVVADSPMAAPYQPDAPFDNPFDFALGAPQTIAPDETIPEEDEFVPLTKDELLAKSDSKTEMWAAMIALGVSLLNRMVAYQQLRKGDKDLVAAFDKKAKESDTVPVYSPGHPYYAARERYSKYEAALEAADDESLLTPAQKKLLGRAIEANLKAKNKNGKIRQASIAETLLEIMLVKALEPMMGLGMVMVNKMSDQTMR